MGGGVMLLDKALGNKFFCLVGLGYLSGGNGKRITVDAGWLSGVAAMFPARSTRTLLGRLWGFESSHDNLLSLHCSFVSNVSCHSFPFIPSFLRLFLVWRLDQSWVKLKVVHIVWFWCTVIHLSNPFIPYCLGRESCVLLSHPGYLPISYATADAMNPL